MTVTYPVCPACGGGDVFAHGPHCDGCHGDPSHACPVCDGGYCRDCGTAVLGGDDPDAGAVF